MNVKNNVSREIFKSTIEIIDRNRFSPDRWLPSPELDPSGGSFVCGSNYFRSVVRAARYTYIRNITSRICAEDDVPHICSSPLIFFLSLSLFLTIIALTRVSRTSHFRNVYSTCSLVKLNARSVKARRNEIRDGWFDNEESNARAREEQNW